MAAASVERVKAVSSRLLWSVLLLISVLLILFSVLIWSKGVATLPVVLIFGALGAFISLQRRLKSLSDEDLQLFQESIPYTWLAPVAGAVMAGILYLLFISGLLAGELFPRFVAEKMDVSKGLPQIFSVYGEAPSEYAKLLFWSFVAGFSERFVTDIIGHFETKVAIKD